MNNKRKVKNRKEELLERILATFEKKYYMRPLDREEREYIWAKVKKLIDKAFKKHSKYLKSSLQEQVALRIDFPDLTQWKRKIHITDLTQGEQVILITDLYIREITREGLKGAFKEFYKAKKLTKRKGYKDLFQGFKKATDGFKEEEYEKDKGDFLT